MNLAPPDQALLLAAVLFAVGLLAVLVRRNLLFLLIGVEIMLNAAGLAFVAAAARHGTADGQVMFLFVLAVAAAEVAVGLALVLRLRKHRDSLDPDAFGGEGG